MMHLQKRPLGKAGWTNGADNLGFLQKLISNATFKDTADLCFNASVWPSVTPVGSVHRIVAAFQKSFILLTQQ
jgi:hypothetical protein